MSGSRNAAAPQFRGDKVVIVGSGIAGLATALLLAPVPVTLVTRGRLVEPGSTAWAQGGIAAAVSEMDAPWRHADDTLAAGCDLCDPDVVNAVTSGGRRAIELLEMWGVAFDRDANGRLELAMEGAHSRPRVLHAGGDRSGATILRALAAAVRSTPTVEVIEGFSVESLLRRDQHVFGVRGKLNGRPRSLEADGVVLATGGSSGLFASTTNPLSSWGSGLWLAAQEGAILKDLEFVQFHPTAIASGDDPMPLASEALRGEGARLVDASGHSIFDGTGASELSARDVVARVVGSRTLAGEAVFLDAANALGASIEQRFPTIVERCRAAGIDPVSEPIPVRPAAHYHMGGIKVDQRGRSSLPNLWACGEVACTGLHGANRLASNSLLEAVVFAEWISRDVKARLASSADAWALHSSPATKALKTYTSPAEAAEVRRLMDGHVGVVREAAGLQRAISRLWGMRAAAASNGRISPQVEVALLVTTAAARRIHTIGGHFRADGPNHDQPQDPQRDMTFSDAFEIATTLHHDTIQRTAQCQPS